MSTEEQLAKIIIIEDEKNIRKDLVKTIRKIDEHIEIFETGSVLESMEIIQENNIDIFLIDIQLDDGNGYELAKRIRKIDRYKLNHIVFITAVPTHAMMAYENNTLLFIYPKANRPGPLGRAVVHTYKIRNQKDCGRGTQAGA